MSQKKKYTLEFVFRSSPSILYNLMTSPSGLAQWFADSVDINDGVYSFIWSGAEERAEVLEEEEDQLIRFRWLDGGVDEFFEFKLEKSEVTSDTVLFVTDFAEEYEMDDQKKLWESQISDLQTRVGG